MKRLKCLFAGTLLLVLASCINANLEEIESYSDSNIIDIRFEYRWIDSNNQLHVKTLNVEKTISDDTHIVECTIKVPDTDNFFTEEIRNNVSLSNICGYFILSTGASVSPLENAPVMGKISDFSNKNFDYEVTAANGSKTIWKLTIIKFDK